MPQDRTCGRDGVLNLGLRDVYSCLKVQNHRVTPGRIVGELLDNQLPRTRDALPVDVSPVIAPPVLPEARELVTLLHEGTTAPRLHTPSLHREAFELEYLRIDHNLCARHEPPDETQESKRLYDPDLRRAQLVEASFGEEHRIPDHLLPKSLNRRRPKRAPLRESVHHLYDRAPRPGRVRNHEFHLGRTPGHEALPRRNTTRISQAAENNETEHKRDEEEARERVGELVKLRRTEKPGREENEGTEKDHLPASGRRSHRDPPQRSGQSSRPPRSRGQKRVSHAPRLQPFGRRSRYGRHRRRYRGKRLSCAKERAGPGPLHRPGYSRNAPGPPRRPWMPREAFGSPAGMPRGRPLRVCVSRSSPRRRSVIWLRSRKPSQRARASSQTRRGSPRGAGPRPDPQRASAGTSRPLRPGNPRPS